MVVYDDNSQEEEYIEDIIVLSPLGKIIRLITECILRALFYLLRVTGNKIEAGNPRIFSFRAVLIPFIGKIIEDIKDGYMDDVFEEPSLRLYQISPLLGSLVNAVSYTGIQLHAHRYKVLACFLSAGYLYFINKNENHETRY